MRHLPFAREAVKQLFSKSSCAMYPAVPKEAAPNYRGRIVYHPEKCIGCGMCERVCSGNAITRTIEKGEEGDKVTLTFNLGSCTFCATCADFCAHKAIEFSGDYHMVATNEEDLLVTGSFTKTPVKRPTPAARSEEKPADAVAEAPAAVKPREDGKPANDKAKCVFCTLCARQCPSGAITVDRANKTWTLDEDKCVGCGACANTCPKKSIVI